MKCIAILVYIVTVHMRRYFNSWFTCCWI